MKFGIIAMAALFVIIGCGDEYYNNRAANGDNDAELYFIESEPSVSPQKDFIYYIAENTTDDSKSGIYRAIIAYPIRQKLLTGDDYHSPSLGFDNNTIVYLDDSGKIYYYHMSTQSIDTSAVGERFESVFFIDENRLLAHRGDGGGQNDSIFLINDTDQVTFLLEGWDPTYVAPDTFVYMNVDSNHVFFILKTDIISYDQPETLFTITSSYPVPKPRWASLDYQSNRLAYCLTWADQRFIYSAEAYETGLNFVDSSDYGMPLILGNDLIIYTGWNGRIYKSNFLGTQSEVFTKP